MGNRVELLKIEDIEKTLASKCNDIGSEYENNKWKYINTDGIPILEWNKICTINKGYIKTINHKYNVDDPACHLLRLRMIWQIAPIKDICQELWKIYLLITTPVKNKYTTIFCKICTRNHSYLNCQLYRQCILCLKIGHIIDSCPDKCPCSYNEIHKKNDHRCELCEVFGHTYKNCPSKCSCGKNHLAINHRCHICRSYIHREYHICEFICQCNSYPKHILADHKCDICYKFGHLEVDCNEKCVCGKEHYLTKHYCEESRNLQENNLKRKVPDINNLEPDAKKIKL